jgi:hypothetical protein
MTGELAPVLRLEPQTQSFLSVQSPYALVADAVTLALQHDVDASISKSRTRLSDRPDPLLQRQIIAKSRHVTAGRSV